MERTNDTIEPIRLGLAFGSTFALLYLGCVLIIMTVSKETAIAFFNSLFHGIDVTSIIRTKMPVYEMVMGIIETFIIGWLTGATIASIYNIGSKK